MIQAAAFAVGSAHRRRQDMYTRRWRGLYDLSVSRAVSGAISVAMIVMIESAMM
jgi:hypothetical protein